MCGVIPHGHNAKEFRSRTALGKSPMRALVAAARVNAEILRVADSLGTIEPGKLSDLVAVAGKPARRYHRDGASRVRDEG